MTPHTLSNPYKTMLLTFQPNRVYGWEREIISILQVVTAADPTSYAIYGIRAIGKSTLLKYLKHPRGAMHHFADYVNPEYGAGGIRRVLWVYINFHRLEEDVNIFFVMYEHLYDELEVENLLNLLQLDEPNREWPKNIAARMLRQTAQRLDRHHGIRVVFLMDDFDIPLLAPQLDRNDDRLLRTISYEAALVIATDEPISEMMPDIADDSPLLGILKPEPIGLISEPAARRLITEPLLPANVTYLPQEVDMLLQVAGRQPFLLTAACEVYFDMRTEFDDIAAQFSTPQGQAEVRVQLLNRLMVQPHIKNVLSLMWSKHGRDHELLVRMANTPNGITGSPAARLATRALAYLDRERGTYRLFSQLFAHFVRQQASVTVPAMPTASSPREEKDVLVNQISASLSPIDRAVFEYLATKQNAVCTFDELIEAVWTDGDGTKRALEAAVHRLRRSVPPGYSIRNVRGKGYKYEPPTRNSTS